MHSSENCFIYFIKIHLLAVYLVFILFLEHGYRPFLNISHLKLPTMKTLENCKKTVLTLIGLLVAIVIYAQDRPSPAATASGEINGATITVNYSSPAVKDRVIWGGLVPYDKVWRAGANEATTFETSKAIKVEGKDLPAGKYGFFTIPGQGEWTIIFNTVSDQWGSSSYDQSKDALRVNVKPVKIDQMNERLSYVVSDNSVALRWEKLEVPVSIK